MRILLERQRLRVGLFDGAPHAVQRADAGIARPREDELLGAARGDELVVDEIGRQARERQIAALLPDDLMGGRETDEVREAFDDHRVAVVHEAADRIAHVHDLGRDWGYRAQAATRSSASASSKMRRPVATSSSSITSGGATRIVLWPHPNSSSPRLNAASSSS